MNFIINFAWNLEWRIIATLRLQQSVVKWFRKESEIFAQISYQQTDIYISTLDIDCIVDCVLTEFLSFSLFHTYTNT